MAEASGPGPDHRHASPPSSGAAASVDREQPIDRPAWANASSIQLVAQLVDTEQTPASAAIQQELQRRLESALAS